MFEFNTEVNVSVIGDESITGGSGKATVKWVMNIEAREYGIKCFGLYVPEQEIEVPVEVYNEETDDEEIVMRKYKLENVKIEEVENLGNLQYLQLVPNELEIWKKEYTLRF